MIELIDDSLKFSFPEVHEDATLSIEFQRTLRIPDDEQKYPLTPGLGSFHLRHIDDFLYNVPSRWRVHGGIMLPMYQSEAMWINFSSSYPFAVKVATGKINAVSGELWKNDLNRTPQDYIVAPNQLWLDGYCVEEGFVRQFVAMPLGSGYSAEEQITGEAEYGGLQIIVYPMKRKAYEKYFPQRLYAEEERPMFSLKSEPDMGLAPGGSIRQEIYDDPYEISDWETNQNSRCYVHICNSHDWQQITNEFPPALPPSAKEYNDEGLPWFEYYNDDLKLLSGSKILRKLKSVFTITKRKKEKILAENQFVNPQNKITLGRDLKKAQVREWETIEDD